MGNKSVIVGWTGRLSLERFCEAAGAFGANLEIVSRVPLPEFGASVLLTHNFSDIVKLLFGRLARYKIAYVDWASTGGRSRNLTCLLIACVLSAGSVKIVKDGDLINTGDFLVDGVKRLFGRYALACIWMEIAAGAISLLATFKRQLYALFYPVITLLVISFARREHSQTRMAEVASKYGRVDFWLSRSRLRSRSFLIAGFYGALFASAGLLVYPALLVCRVLRVWRRPLDSRTTILLVSHECRLNGAPQSLLTLLAGIDRKEFRPLLLVPGEGQLADAARSLGIDVYVAPLSQILMQRPNRVAMIRHFLRLLVSIGPVMSLITRERVSRIHINVAVTPDAALAGKLLAIPVIWHFRETIGATRWNHFQVRVLRWFSSLVVCNSEFTRTRIAGLGCPYTHSVTLHNCIDDKFALWRTARAEVRRELKVAADTVLIGCVGQITHDKGQDTFVRSAGLIAKSHPKVRFALVGTLENAPYVAELRRMAAEAGIEDRVLFVGFRTDIGRVMSAFDIHVTPSRWDEPFGRVALESMLLGAVSVVSNRGGLPEIVQSGESGVVFDAEDAEALARALATLIEDPKERERLSENGVARARAEFSGLRHVDDFQHLLRYPVPPSGVGRVTAAWRRLAKVLPVRLRASAWCVPAYLVLAVLVPVVWSIAIASFLLALPFALVGGGMARRSAKCKSVAVLAYQAKRNASTRFRVTRLFDQMPDKGVKAKIFYPSGDRLGDLFYSSLFYGDHPYLKDFYYYVIIFPARLYGIACSLFYRSVLIQYELFYEGPMLLERLVLTLHPHVLYDYDDSLFAFQRYAKELPKILPRFRHVVVGNDYLADYTQKFNKRITLIPTCPDQVDTEHVVQKGKKLVIGWVGNPANLSYLRMLKGPIGRLSARHDIELLVISAGPYQLQWFGLEGLPIRRRQWALQRELADLQEMDIGVMPVDEDEVGRGKCGFKALQYMAVNVATVASPVGVNADIVRHGESGYLADNEEEWEQYLERLIEDETLRKLLGASGCRAVKRGFDQGDQVDRWIELIE